MKIRFSILSIIAISYLIGFFGFDNWKNTMMNGDSSGYYMHLVSSIINQDVGDYDQTIKDFLSNYPTAKDPRDDKFGIRKTDKDKYYIKYTLGVAVMELPAMLVAHTIAKINDSYQTDGWSLPYSFCINFSKVIYIILGFWFLITSLLKYFTNKIVAITCLSIALGTNLLYHGTFLSLAHSFLFFDFCLLIYLSDRFYNHPSKKKAFGIGILVGLITLTRVPEVIGLIIPLLWGISNYNGFKTRLGFFKRNYQYLLLALLGLIIAFTPQIMYWYYVSGRLFFNPYQGENFNFLKPNILNGWFNFRNGWLIYTPIMLFSLIGFFHLKKIASSAFLVSILFTLFIAWIHYSYYVWNFYPGMGSRIMIECYPILAFPLAAFYTKISKRKISFYIIASLICLFICLNIFQSWQMKKGIIYTQNGNPAFYAATFGKSKSSLKTLRTYDTNRKQPKLNDLVMIDTILFNDFEQIGIPNTNDIIKYSGNQSINNVAAQIVAENTIDISKTNIKARDWVYVGIKAMRKRENQVWDRNLLEELFCTIEDGNGKKTKTSKIKIGAHIGNKNHSLFHTGATELWDEAGFFFRISSKVENDWKLKVYVRNLYQKDLYLDDLVVIHYR